MRLDRPWGSLLLLWPTLTALWIAAEGTPAVYLIVIFTLGTFVMRSAGCVINDYADRHVDRFVARTKDRPLPWELSARHHASCMYMHAADRQASWLVSTAAWFSLPPLLHAFVKCLPEGFGFLAVSLGLDLPKMRGDTAAPVTE